ncbi:MAG: sulfatase-like hydrolase/transferase [Pseudomonadota bacterium]
MSKPADFKTMILSERTAGYLHIFALSAFALTQPLLDVISRHAEFLLAHDVGPVELLTLVAVLAFLVPLGAIFLECIVGLFSNVLSMFVHRWTVGSLVALICLPVAEKIITKDSLVVIASAAVGLFFVALYSVCRQARVFLTWMSPVVLLFPTAFLVSSSMSGLLLSGDTRSHASKIAVKSAIPIVFVIFDELPVTSLISGNGDIDRSAFPNFASLARDAVWYRNATTVADFTTVSVPSMLTGKYPDQYRLPTAAEYPDNLFTLLGGVYAISATESGTALCPKELRGTALVSKSIWKRMKDLLSDVGYIYLQIVLPDDYDDAFPNVTKTLKDFGDQSEKAVKSSARVTAYREFLKSIGAGTGSSLFFGHFDLPHVPWVYYPSGERYNYSGVGLLGVFGLSGDEQWDDDEWAVQQAYQRHLLQVGFVDRLLGQLLERLKQADLYGRSLIIVTSDHGAGFRAGDNRRRLTTGNFEDIAAVPLIIKYPASKRRGIDDRNAQSIDILPTIADVLGVALPWPVDGVSLLGTPRQTPTRTVYAYRDETGLKKFEPTCPIDIRNSGTLKKKTSMFRSDPGSGGVYRLGPFAELLGREVNQFELSHNTGSTEIEYDQERAYSGDMHSSEYVLGNVTGSLRTNEARGGRLHLALAVAGRIRALTISTPICENEARFSSILPEDALRFHGARVDAFVVKPQASGPPRLEPLNRRGQEACRLSESEEAELETISCSGKGLVPVRHEALLGRLEGAPDTESGSTEFSGWAADILHGRPVDEILVFADGTLVYRTTTNRPRRDLLDYLGGTRFLNSGFWFTLPNEMLKYVHELRFFAVSYVGTGAATELNYSFGYKWSPERTAYRLEGSAKQGTETIVCPLGQRIPLKKRANVGRVEGVTEHDDKTILCGWAVDGGNASLPVTLVMLADKKFLGSARTDGYRRDISNRFGTAHLSKSAFRLEVPSSVVSEVRELRIFVVSTAGRASEVTYPVRYKWHSKSGNR